MFHLKKKHLKYEKHIFNSNAVDDKSLKLSLQSLLLNIYTSTQSTSSSDMSLTVFELALYF